MFDLRPLTTEHMVEALRVSTTALLMGHLNTEELRRRALSWELSRSIGAFEDGEIIGHVRAWPLHTTVPGGARLPTAGISSVGVLPTHTRRGVLRALKTEQLRQERAAGTVLASLRASEAVIYGRFGYGLAGLAMDVTIDRRRGAFTDRGVELSEQGRTRLLTPTAAARSVPEIYERVGRGHVGAIDRPGPWWPDRYFSDYGGPTDSSSRWIAVHEGTGRGSDARAAAGQVASGAAPHAAGFEDVDGYVDYEVPQPEPTSDVVKVRDLFAANPTAYAALWRHVLDLDLASTIVAKLRPVDEPLRWLLSDPRALQVTRVVDEQWVRLVDVEAALAARSYAPCGDRVVVGIEDPLFGENTGCYAVDGTGASRVEEQADVALGVAEAGAVYLGGTSFADLRLAGRATELRPGAVAAADRLFAVRPLPWCGTFF